MRYPKNQLKENQYTPGGEFIDTSNNRIYSGYYWEINGTMCHKPKNNSLVTDCPNQDFGSPMYKGSTGLCEKQKWSKLCKVTWDGITNNNDLCH